MDCTSPIVDPEDKYSKKPKRSFVKRFQAPILFSAVCLMVIVYTSYGDSLGQKSLLEDRMLVQQEYFDQLKIKDDGLAKIYPQYEVSSDELGEQDEESVDDTESIPVDTFEEHTSEDNRLFEDQEEYDKAPIIQVKKHSKTIKYRKIVLKTEKHFRVFPTRLYVPRLRKDIKLSPQRFHELFTLKHMPVIVNFDSMRHLNFTTKSYTLDELQKIYPNTKPKVYKYGDVVNEEIDLGPAVASLTSDAKLRKTSDGRNYPRNTKIQPSSLKKLDIKYPPFKLPSQGFMLPSLWFGATSSSTPLHADCCDNFAVMIAGTKRWTLAPPSEARVLHPVCNGGLCWVKELPHADEDAKSTKEKNIIKKTQLVAFDLNPGEMLFLPEGWFHHIENVVPTVMINFWTVSKKKDVSGI